MKNTNDAQRVTVKEGSAGVVYAVPAPSWPAAAPTPRGIVHVVSVSGGKDSLATLLIAIIRFGRQRIRAIFCDTGNEHEDVYAYLDYLERELGIKIHRLKASFVYEIAAKRMFIARDKRTRREYARVERRDAAGNIIYRRDNAGRPELEMVWKNGQMDLVGIPKMRKTAGIKVRWSNKSKRRALEILQPTDNPYLDLCMWKGRFPSRKAQFCTEHLKRNPAVSFQIDLIDQGYTVVSWQGVRRDESQNRRNAKSFEPVGGGLYTFRPIAAWTAQQTIDFARGHGVRHNPLYAKGMNRVGCMPCINAAKDELREIAARFPEHIERIHAWELLVAQASKRQAATFIPAPGITPREAKDRGIYSVIEWSRTTRGGRQFDLLADVEDVHACSSAYGLCE